MTNKQLAWQAENESQTMKKGDKIAVIDEQLEGMLEKVAGNEVVFTTADGFTYTYPKEKVVVISPDFNKKITAKTVPVKDLKKTVKTRTKTHRNKPVFDLHIEKILAKHQHLSTGQKLEIQLQELQRIIQKMQRQNQPEFILIHGIGKGKLKSEIVKILQAKGYQYTDASYRKYGEGALLAIR